jgi:hypothetical protein
MKELNLIYSWKCLLLYKISGLLTTNRLLKNVASEAETRKNEEKKRSLLEVNEHFEPNFDAVSARTVILQQPAKGETMQSNAYQTATTSQATSQAATYFLAKVFNWMAIGLGLTGITAFMVTQSPAAMNFIFGKPFVFYGLIIGELGLVFYLSARVQKMSAQAATGLFILYAALNGVTLSAILLMYTSTSVAATFFITAGMFGAMATYGFVTKKDLSSWGSFLFMGLIGIIIASVVNIFLGSSMMSWVISGIGVLVFTGLTAYDVQKIMRMGGGGIMSQGDSAIRKGAILGALALYLDFINLFLMLLRFFGNRR